MKKEKEDNQNTDPVSVLGIKIDPITKKDLRKKIVYFLKDGKQHYIVTTNSEFIVSAQQDQLFKKIINLADLSLADGNGVIWASYFLSRPVSVSPSFPRNKQKTYRKRKIRNQLLFTLALNLLYPRLMRNIIPERLSGADVILDICQILSENDYSLYILGGEGETPVTAKFALEKLYPDLIITGVKGGFQKDSLADEVLVEAVNKAKPDVLFVALGHPHQEKWIFRNLDKLPSVKLAIGIGGTLDFLSGKSQRAPELMQRANLEWLFRFVQEPRRYRRIKRAVHDFPKMVYQYKIVEIERAKEQKGKNKAPHAAGPKDMI